MTRTVAPGLRRIRPTRDGFSSGTTPGRTWPDWPASAGLVRLPLEVTGGKDVLLFSTPDNPGGSRVRMTVWASFDRGETWPLKRLVYEGHSAYSSLAAAPDGTIYLLLERGKKKLYESVAVARFNLPWLVEGRDWRKLLND